MIRINRVYEPPDPEDGKRFWWFAQGKLSPWMGGSRGWRPAMPYAVDSTRSRQGEGFQRRYFAELGAHPKVWQPLIQAAQEGSIPRLFSARDPQHNSAAVLRR